jgi:hypothetical protein
MLRGGETWSREKYGLNAVICFPRLWLVLDDDVKAELSEARRQLDQTVEVFIFGVLLIVWTFLTPLAVLAAAVVAAAA